MDVAAPVIVAFTSLNLLTWNVGASNISATRIVVSPRVFQNQSLAVYFGDAIGTIGILPIECDTPQKALTIYHDSFRTIPELQLIQSTASMGDKFRCKVTITDIDTTRDWCYLGCAICCKAAVRHDAPLWCDKCKATVLLHQLKQCFHIRLMGQDDDSACAPFLLLGQTAETLLLVSANALFAASPDRVNGYPSTKCTM
ncbi:unnamed protein product [Linum trigynum]|uniref:Uncharacterized protein n=1 Tax=Linum trigynum TaxID=586398 RepID=A0AAV2G6U0_9ROSI